MLACIGVKGLDRFVFQRIIFMKKTLIFLLMLIVAVSLFVGCKNEPEAKTYKVGDTGPAGGYIFYDCDADNDSGNADGLISSECGWRFLEAAPENVGKYVFGYYRTSDTGSNTAVGTSAEIGKGKANTEKLVETMGATTYKAESGSEKKVCAAAACLGYEKNGYKDWFLPSSDELKQMYENLIKAEVVTFDTGFYWSSFENPAGGTVAQMLVYSNGKIMPISRGTSAYELPVRSF